MNQMRFFRSLAGGGSLLAALAVGSVAHAQTSPNDAMRTCKNEASERMRDIPRAYISVQRGSDTGSGNYMINFRAEPRGGPPASGFCIVSRFGQVEEFRFDPPPGGGSAGGGSGGGRISPQAALQACKNTASNRMPNIPRAYISVYRATDPGNGGYIINFRAESRFGPPASGFCNITWNGRMQDFQFDSPLPPPGGNPGGRVENFGGRDPLEAMRSCKSVVSARFPNVPLAFIEVDQPRVNGGSLLSMFRVRAPDGLHASGSCDVFKNGKVNLSVR
jgi:hypothetical protein